MINSRTIRGNEDWKISYTGFLEKKNYLGVWNYYWVILENNKLYLYQDESERVLKYKILITSTTVVESVPSTDPSRSFLFSIQTTGNSRPDDRLSSITAATAASSSSSSQLRSSISSPLQSQSQQLTLSALDFSSLEEWMIAIIQTINGSYRSSENFCTGQTLSADTRSSLILPSSGGMSVRFSRSIYNKDPEKVGYLLKQGSEFKTWKRRWFHLKHNHLRYFEHEPAEGLKGFRFIDDESKVIMLPTGLTGQSFGFCLITLDSMSGQSVSLRLSASNEDEMYGWISALRCAIRRYTEDQFSIPIDEQDVTDEKERAGGDENEGAEGGEAGEEVEGEVTQESEDEDREDQGWIGCGAKIASRTMSVTYIDSPLIRVPPEESIAALSDTPRSFYINDETVWAKINRQFSPRIHTPQNDDLQRLYLLHFCALIPGTNYIIVEVFEHQRYLPLKGWSCLHLLFSDCSKLANCIGIKYPDRYLRRADPPLDYNWVEEKSLMDYEGINLHEYGIHTPWKWTACRAFTIEGEKAWCYGTSFDDIRKKYEDPELRIQSHTYQRTIDVVRRRRWIRLAVEINPTVASPSSPSSSSI